MQKKKNRYILNPESDPRGAGYNIIQSKLAIGAGGLTGMGLLKGNQTQLGFLYPKTTDFIFSVIGRRNGIHSSRNNNNIICNIHNKNNIYSQNSQRQRRNTNSIRNSRKFSYST